LIGSSKIEVDLRASVIIKDQNRGSSVLRQECPDSERYLQIRAGRNKAVTIESCAARSLGRVVVHMGLSSI
jgi:hypothetical protein